MVPGAVDFHVSECSLAGLFWSVGASGGAAGHCQLTDTVLCLLCVKRVSDKKMQVVL